MPGSTVTSIASLSCNVDQSGAVRAQSKQTTSHNIAKIQIEWRIKTFNSLMKLYTPGTELCSEAVSSPLVPRALWKLEADPNGWREEHSGHISVFFHLTGPMADDGEVLNASYHICFRDEANNRTETIHQETTQFGPSDFAWGIERISHERVRRALQPDGSLLIVGEVEFFPPSSGKTGAKRSSPERQQTTDEAALLSSWRNSVGQLSVTGTDYDCVLLVGGTELRMHKGMLSALSPVFNEMFSNPHFHEASKGTVTIEDLSVQSVKALRAYVYKGSIDWGVFGEGKCDLLRLADKYLMGDLKAYMEGLLARRVNDHSLTDLAVLADSHSCRVLKKACVHYLCSNYAQVMLSPKWEDLVRERGDVAANLLQQMRDNSGSD